MRYEKRVKKLEQMQGTTEFKLLVVEKIGDDLYQKWDDKDTTYSKRDLDELLEYYTLDKDERIKQRARIIERKLFGTKETE